MNWDWLIWGGIGMAIGLVLFLVVGFIILKIRATLERRMIKAALKNGNFLKMLDPKDFDYEKWKGLIPINLDELKNLNSKTFTKKEEIQNG